MYINILHLFWIIPLVSFFTYIIASIFIRSSDSLDDAYRRGYTDGYYTAAEERAGY